MKVSPAFSKAAGCRGRALARAPQSAELSCAYLSAGGGLRGNPRRGFPLFFTLLRVRRYVGRGSLACPAFRPHFFGACPKKRCRAAKEKRFFYPGGSTIRVSATSRWTGRSSPDLGRGTGGCRELLRRLCGGATVQGHGRFLLPPNALYSRSKRQAKGFYLSPVLIYALR